MYHYGMSASSLADNSDLLLPFLTTNFDHFGQSSRGPFEARIATLLKDLKGFPPLIVSLKSYLSLLPVSLELCGELVPLAGQLVGLVLDGLQLLLDCDETSVGGQTYFLRPKQYSGVATGSLTTSLT